MQNVRQEKLLAMLCEREGWMTSRQLARLLGVSDRTIRSDVDAINKRITPPPIESNVRLGYRMMEDARTGLFAPEKRCRKRKFRRRRVRGAFILSRSFCLRPGN